jgi:hypothetical protein
MAVFFKGEPHKRYSHVCPPPHLHTIWDNKIGFSDLSLKIEYHRIKKLLKVELIEQVHIKKIPRRFFPRTTKIMK